MATSAPTLNSNQLANYQNVPYGTAAWQRGYSRRNQVENTNSRLRDKGTLEAGACRALGILPRTIAAVAAAVTCNLALHDPERHNAGPTGGHASPHAPIAGQNTATHTEPATGRAPP